MLLSSGGFGPDALHKKTSGGDNRFGVGERIRSTGDVSHLSMASK